ncbi:MAG: hypothetical protein ABJM65_00675 [Ascidiaceihabitans sp.]|uniref:hypothetical protein n=1 Tax=Ascidiaceihabitans sp. TaxID=1872644 RepID=UPI0032971646
MDIAQLNGLNIDGSKIDAKLVVEHEAFMKTPESSEEQRAAFLTMSEIKLNGQLQN